MAKPKIFVSSTCYDLSIVRGQLRTFIEDMGYEPIMSDYNDIPYDPRIHTHTSCIEEVTSCDMVLVIMGSRYGGQVVPQALCRVDLESIESASSSVETLKKKENISITQLEVLKAIEQSIPVFPFIEERVMHDYATYEKNKSKSIIESIEFSSIEKPETAKFIFEFINFLRFRSVNNGIASYAKYQDIEDALRRQWAGFFQRLMSEQRSKQTDARRIDALTEQFEDLKAAILTAVGSKNEKEVARGVVRFRKLFDFLRSFDLRDYSFVLSGNHTWDAFLEFMSIKDIREAMVGRNARIYNSRPTFYMLKEDNTFYEVRLPFRISDLTIEWDAFMRLEPEVRSIIFDALSEMRVVPPGRYVSYIARPFEEYMSDLDSILVAGEEIMQDRPRASRLSQSIESKGYVNFTVK